MSADDLRTSFMTSFNVLAGECDAAVASVENV